MVRPYLPVYIPANISPLILIPITFLLQFRFLSKPLVLYNRADTQKGLALWRMLWRLKNNYYHIIQNVTEYEIGPGLKCTAELDKSWWNQIKCISTWDFISAHMNMQSHVKNVCMMDKINNIFETKKKTSPINSTDWYGWQFNTRWLKMTASC